MGNDTVIGDRYVISITPKLLSFKVKVIDLDHDPREIHAIKTDSEDTAKYIYDLLVWAYKKEAENGA